MCGIFGVVNFSEQPVDINLLRSMGRQMLHRGPDDEGFWVGGSIGIGMRRLSIIDLANGQQPISNENRDIHIVLNGEIYNYLELRNELIAHGHIFSTNSDVEVVLHLYEEMALDAIHKLNGMFSFALVDERKRLLWVARDRLGIKPLFYSYTSEHLIFSSDLSSIASATKASIDIKRVAEYLGNSYISDPYSIYQGIKKLEPGSQLLINDGNLQHFKYWDLRKFESRIDNLLVAEAALEELLLDAVKLQLRSDVPVGVFLSGGIDSSAMAALAAQALPSEQIATFTANFFGKIGDDARFAKIMARSISANHHDIIISSEEQEQALECLISSMDEPMADSAIVATFIISKAARENGYKVLLSGAGGDEIFGGYSRHFPERVGSSFWFAKRKMAAIILGALMDIKRPGIKLRMLSPACNFAVNISGSNIEFLRQSIADKSIFNSIIDKYEYDYGEIGQCSSLELMKIDSRIYLPNNVLALTDKATMAASVEGRVPLLDHRIVEFAFSLSEALNPLNANEKGIFKNVLKKYLPLSVLNRSKEGFNAPMNIWIDSYYTSIQKEIKENPSPILKEFMNLNIVQLWLSDTRLRRAAGQSLYSIFVLNKWLNRHSQ